MKLTFKITGISLVAAILAIGCADSEHKPPAQTNSPASPASPAPVETSGYDPKRGEGKWNESNVDITSFDAARAASGKTIIDSKCASCHKLSAEKLVGPGWKDVTKRHEPYWIMNFITNPDPMIDKDPKVQAQLELCLVRMPNQNLEDADARNILEFMRQNDGAK